MNNISKEFALILDDCVERLNRGESLENCVARYSEYAVDLRACLTIVEQAKKNLGYFPSKESRSLARNKLLQQMNAPGFPSFSEKFRLVFRRWMLPAAAVASVLVLAIAGFVAFSPSAPMMLGANPNGNFVLLISDDVNAIADFSKLNVTIDKVRLFETGTPGQWFEFIPETKTVDLTLLPGEKTQAIWQGNVPPGEYTKVFLYISQVSGTLKLDGQVIDIKLPSDKLQLNNRFNIQQDTTSGFIFDLTVFSAGNQQSNQKYILKPQATESGPTANPGKGQQNGMHTSVVSADIQTVIVDSLSSRQDVIIGNALVQIENQSGQQIQSQSPQQENGNQNGSTAPGLLIKFQEQTQARNRSD